jgi:hypothetical protein
MTQRRSLMFASAVAICSMLAPVSAYAQDETIVEAEVDRETVELGDSFEYTVTIATRTNEELRMVREPDLRPFTIERTLKMPQFIVQNGVTERRLTLTYTLRTRRTGEFEIAAPQLLAGKQRLEANAVKLKVVDRGAAPGQATPRRDDAAFVEIQVDPQRDPYVGEQITLEYALFLDTRRLDAQPKPPTEPALDAFWAEDLSDKTAGTKQIVRVGQRFVERILLRKYAVFPLRAGPTTVEPMTVTLAPTGFGIGGREVDVASEPIKLNVLPLPPDAPEGFSEGNIGAWDLLVTTDTLQARVGRPLHVRVSVKGHGQIARIELPKLADGDAGLADVRIAAGDPEVTNSFQGGKFGGTKLMRYALTPLKQGEFTIPALKFAYFDPTTGRYQTKHSAPIKVSVADGDSALLEAQAPRTALKQTRSSEEEVMSGLAGELRAPRRAETFRSRAGSWPSHPATIALIMGLWACLLGMWLWPRLNRRLAQSTPKRKQAQARKRAQELIQRGEELAGAEGWALIQEGIVVWMSEVAGLPAGAITERELPDRLARLDAPQEAARTLAQVLRACDRARFTPEADSGSAAQREAARSAHAAINTLHASINQGVMQTLAPLALALIASAALLIPTPAQAQTPPSPPAAEAAAPTPAQALAAYDTQRWAEAATAWEALRKQHPHDPTLMYNEAIARAKLGELGAARLLLERAALRSPGDSAISANLELVTRMVQIKAMERSRGRPQRLSASDEFFWWSLARRVTEEVFAVALLLGLLAAIGCTAARRRTKQEGARDTLGVLVALAALLALSATIGWAARARIMEQTRPVVLLSSASVVREGPSPHAARRQVGQQIVQGLMFPMEEQRDGWVHIRLHDELTGWLPAAEVGEVN